MIDDLYSARILTLAANLPHAGRLASPEGTGERVAKLCGSRAIVDVSLDHQGRVMDFAQDVKACALGQAAAGVLGQSVLGAAAAERGSAPMAKFSVPAAMRAGAVEFLTKPFNDDVLLTAIAGALEKSRTLLDQQDQLHHGSKIVRRLPRKLLL